MKQLLIIDKREYLILNRDLTIAQISALATKYAEFPDRVVVGQDIRLSFPEFIGLEDTLIGLLQQEQGNFILQGITRHKEQNSLLYFDIDIKNIDNNLIVFFEDVTELMTLKQSLLQQVNEAEILLSSLKRFEECTNKIIASMGDILIIVTHLGKIERINKAARKLFGYSHSELLDRPISRLITSQDFDHQQLYNSYQESNKSVQKVELTCQNKNGEAIEIEFNFSIVPTEIKGLFKCIYLGRNITERKRIELEMRKALEREKELRQLKSSFVSMASHEFRNPLSSIMICTDLLLHRDRDISEEEYNLYLNLIKSSANNMQYLLEDILVLSKTESANSAFNPDWLDLEKFCQQIIKELKIIYQDRQINFNGVNFPLQIYGDKKLIRHILTNLLSNAIKYSPVEETVDLKLTYSEAEQLITLEVRDRGIGISAEVQKHLFESFYRGNNVGDIPGTGLGLSIVKKAIDLHGGTITVESEIGIGTIMTVTLPRNNNS
ncbi:MAG: PAS domain-containing sensor histidine kinase [Xenococcaceae cyanobacterium MO_188.B32]|nr:PAS domain-containing sensor histidine kinase [Xenococcaceae cyanobacterium MO_188.B32]